MLLEGWTLKELLGDRSSAMSVLKSTGKHHVMSHLKFQLGENPKQHICSMDEIAVGGSNYKSKDTC